MYTSIALLLSLGPNSSFVMDSLNFFCVFITLQATVAWNCCVNHISFLLFLGHSWIKSDASHDHTRPLFRSQIRCVSDRFKSDFYQKGHVAFCQTATAMRRDGPRLEEKLPAKITWCYDMGETIWVWNLNSILWPAGAARNGCKRTQCCMSRRHSGKWQSV